MKLGQDNISSELLPLLASYEIGVIPSESSGEREGSRMEDIVDVQNSHEMSFLELLQSED